MLRSSHSHLEVKEDELVEHTRRDRSKGRKVESSHRHQDGLIEASFLRRRRQANTRGLTRSHIGGVPALIGSVVS